MLQQRLTEAVGWQGIGSCDLYLLKAFALICGRVGRGVCYRDRPSKTEYSVCAGVRGNKGSVCMA